MPCPMLGLVMVIVNVVAEPAPAWYLEYAAARDAAVTADRPLLVLLCDASSQYGKLTSRAAFVSDRVERVLQERYVRLFVDTETDTGKSLARQFEVERGPHWVILDRTGKWQVYYQSGNLTEPELAAVLARFSAAKLDGDGKPVRPDATPRRPGSTNISTEYVSTTRPSARIISVSEADFQREVIERSHEHPVVVDFWAEWCGPCRAMAPTLERVVNENRGNLTLAKINVDHNVNLTRRYNIESIPAVKIFRHGKLVSEFVGVAPESQIRQVIAAVGAIPDTEQVAQLPK